MSTAFILPVTLSVLAIVVTILTAINKRQKKMTIDKNKVIKGLECCYLKASCAKCPYDGYGQCVTSVAADAIALLKEQETVKRGRWIPVDSYSAFGGDKATWCAYGNPTAFHYCSECKEQARADERGNEILSKYCPHCGAKMDEGEEYE